MDPGHCWDVREELVPDVFLRTTVRRSNSRMGVGEAVHAQNSQRTIVAQITTFFFFWKLIVYSCVKCQKTQFETPFLNLAFSDLFPYPS